MFTNTRTNQQTNKQTNKHDGLQYLLAPEVCLVCFEMGLAMSHGDWLCCSDAGEQSHSEQHSPAPSEAWYSHVPASEVPHYTADAQRCTLIYLHTVVVKLLFMWIRWGSITNVERLDNTIGLRSSSLCVCMSVCVSAKLLKGILIKFSALVDCGPSRNCLALFKAVSLHVVQVQ